MKNASGLFNLMRNLGGAIGLAAINTVLNDRMDLHLARLHEQVNWLARSRRPRRWRGSPRISKVPTRRPWRSSR